MTDRSSQTPAQNPPRHLDVELSDKNSSPKEIDAVKSFMSVFSNVTRNYSLYPKEHAISENLLIRFRKSLDDCFQMSPTLKLDIEKERICFKGIEVYCLNEQEN